MEIPLPLTIENSNGEKLISRITVKDGVEYLAGKNLVQPHASGKGIRFGEPKKYAGQGETVVFKAGTPPKFWNAGPEILHCSGYLCPPDYMMYFLTQIFTSTSENDGRPGIYDAAFLLDRYKLN